MNAKLFVLVAATLLLTSGVAAHGGSYYGFQPYSSVEATHALHDHAVQKQYTYKPVKRTVYKAQQETVYKRVMQVQAPRTTCADAQRVAQPVRYQYVHSTQPRTYQVTRYANVYHHQQPLVWY
ncbi:MAG: hypothetical protein OXR66_01560 [Candidatus Woesearchaeota archaeon]|nr:hypothetical protein [Candidatus Woesearchaeota archaeon]